jgi:hypothetical protein
MTIPSSDKRDHLKRARALLATGSAADLRYAALELRMCLEAMTYDKLRSFANYVTPSFLARTWQPPKLLKAMAQFDSNADKSFILKMGVETTPGGPVNSEGMKFVGEHKAFSCAWLTKHYNKLGSYLHLQAQATPSPAQEAKIRTNLESIFAEIEEAQTGSILGSWMGQVIQFDCHVCAEQITSSLHFVENERRSTCLNPECEAEYLVEKRGEGFGFLLRASTIPCACGHTIVVENKHITDGHEPTCPSCKRKYKLKCNWSFKEVAEPPTEEAAAATNAARAVEQGGDASSPSSLPD